MSMTSTPKHFFPGGNTPRGFFSYYDQVLRPEDAEKIFFIKGGPGTGKSTFMRKIGEDFIQEGLTVDFLHCSSDPDSLDGILIREKRIAMMDATAPHTMDPRFPGAADCILNLGDFWDETLLRRNRTEIIQSGKRISSLFQRAYDYLAAAGNMRNCLLALKDERIQKDSMYRIAAVLINEELSHKELSNTPGTVRKLFASAITPKGLQSHIETLLQDCEKIYVLEGDAGTAAAKILDRFLESALYRGLHAETFHCPMDPEGMPEHLIVPQLKLALVTSSKYHPLTEKNLPVEPQFVRLERIMDPQTDAAKMEIERDCSQKFEELLEGAVSCLAAAKEEHDRLEDFYVPGMNFEALEGFREKVREEIKKVLTP